MNSPSLFHGIISGSRRRSHDEVAERSDRIASGLHALGVKPGDSVCMLMRNDIAFVEAAYAAMRLGAYGVPINWHFKPEEVNYVLVDSGTRVLIAHAKDDGARRRYERFGFVSSPTDELHMILFLKDVRNTLATIERSSI